MSSGEQVRGATRLSTERVTEAYGLVLLLTLLTFLALSWLPSTDWARMVSVLLAGCTVIVALLGSGVGPPRVRAAGVIVIVAAVLATVAAGAGSRWVGVVALVLVSIVVVAAQGAIMRRVLTAQRVNLRTILGALSTYALFGIVFTYVYAITGLIQDRQFFVGGGAHNGDFVFFSFTTLTTTGYGNLVPADEPGKSFAVLEMLIGQIFLVTLVAGLVSLWRPERGGLRRREAESTDEDSRSRPL